jgi:hypothetical protein
MTQRATRIAVSMMRATTQRVPICCLFMCVLLCLAAGERVAPEGRLGSHSSDCQGLRVIAS